MKCKLCLQEKPLLKQSHIVPNFIYKELHDVGESFLQINLDKRAKKEKSTKKMFTGYFESNILCKDCDNNLLGRLEHYGCTILYGGNLKGINLTNEVTLDGAEWINATGVDYKKFKLFLLSILWRFSIARGDFYRFVNLGKHEEIIRKMIFEDNPGDELDYPCSLSSYRKHKELPTPMIGQPLIHRFNGGICYSVVMNGILYTFYISKPLIPDFIKEVVVNRNNELKILNIPKDSAIKIIKKHFRIDLSGFDYEKYKEERGITKK